VCQVSDRFVIKSTHQIIVMEEGSLLQEALAAAAAHDDNQQSALLVDVYLLLDENTADHPVDHLLQLAELAVRLNHELQQQQAYPWLSGGDGPVFGIHVSSSNGNIPHLRAQCRYYGVSVDDEWQLVGWILQQTCHGISTKLAVECWDVDDGQLLLIEAAEHLPAWVDRLGPEQCRHRCWIVEGQVTLIRPVDTQQQEPLSLRDALTALQQQQQEQVVERAPEAVQRAIRNRVDRVERRRHCAAVALPRAVAHLFQQRPDLVATACRLFVEQTAIGGKKQSTVSASSTDQDDDDYLAGACQDWVWTTLPFGRTAYAMLRTVTAAPDWKTEDAVPAPLNAMLEVKQLRRVCAVEATPHLRHGLQLGVRLVAGLQHGLEQQQTAATKTNPFPESNNGSLQERRVLCHWSRVAAQVLAGDKQHKNSDSDWLARAWQAGPNQAAHNLQHVLQCPVFDPELVEQQSSLTPLSHPETTLPVQIRQLLRRGVEAPDFSSVPPRANQVDREDWMWMSGDDDELLRRSGGAAETTQQPTINDTTTTAPLDQMLTDVQSFMAGQSSVEGVATTKHEQPSSSTTDAIAIDPTVFLNILHATLQAPTAQALTERLQPAASDDPFFSQEDYNLMRADDDDDDESNDEQIVELMQAMDEELSRRPDGDNDEVHVLSNLLQSLDASAGGPGPIKNMLSEMGIHAPDVVPSSEVDGKEDDDDDSLADRD